MSPSRSPEDYIRKLTRKCVHFNGIQHDYCEAGINYHEQAGTNFGALRRLPCLLDHRSSDDKDHVGCPRASYPTREEAEAKASESRRRIQEYMGQIAKGRCPNCGSEEWSQVGRCVYCDKCHHRLYQGTLPEGKRKPCAPPVEQGEMF